MQQIADTVGISTSSANMILQNTTHLSSESAIILSLLSPKADTHFTVQHIIKLFTSAEEVMFSLLFVCLFV